MSPHTFNIVAGASINHPIVAISVNAAGGNPYRETISISPIKPPPGIPDMTTPLAIAIIRALTYVNGEDICIPNTLKRKNIFNIEP